MEKCCFLNIINWKLLDLPSPLPLWPLFWFKISQYLLPLHFPLFATLFRLCPPAFCLPWQLFPHPPPLPAPCCLCPLSPCPLPLAPLPSSLSRVSLQPLEPSLQEACLCVCFLRGRERQALRKQFKSAEKLYLFQPK